MDSAFFDNKTRLVKDDLVARMRAGDKVSVAASTFSIYAYGELRGQLKDAGEFRFIFTEPAFTPEGAPKEVSVAFQSLIAQTATVLK